MLPHEAFAQTNTVLLATSNLQATCNLFETAHEPQPEAHEGTTVKPTRRCKSIEYGLFDTLTQLL